MEEDELELEEEEKGQTIVWGGGLVGGLVGGLRWGDISIDVDVGLVERRLQKGRIPRSLELQAWHWMVMESFYQPITL